MNVFDLIINDKEQVSLNDIFFDEAFIPVFREITKHRVQNNISFAEAKDYTLTWVKDVLTEELEEKQKSVEV